MSFSYKPYQESDEVKKARQKMNSYSDGYKESAAVSALRNQWQNQQAQKPASWNGGQYGAAVNNALNQILNRKKFSYDLNGDALYQQYRDQYQRQGKLAMQDTYGQAVQLNGGYNTSYGQMAGQQAYNAYMQELNAKVPELYQIALDTYTREGDELNNRYGLLRNQYDTEYGQYRDAVNDWNTDVDRAYNYYTNERGNEQSMFSADRDYAANAYNSAYNRDYGSYNDAYDRAFSTYQQNVSEEQAARQLALDQLKLLQSNNITDEQVDEKESVLWNYGTKMTDAQGNEYVVFTDNTGKQQKKVDPGRSPYTGGMNADVKTNGEYDPKKAFSNGYQPNNIGGKKLKKAGVSNMNINGRSETVWTPDGENAYVWDGTQNMYLYLGTIGSLKGE